MLARCCCLDGLVLDGRECVVKAKQQFLGREYRGYIPDSFRYSRRLPFSVVVTFMTARSLRAELRKNFGHDPKAHEIITAIHLASVAGRTEFLLQFWGVD